LARTKKIGALKLVTEMEAEFLAAIESDEKFDFAGAHRSLGLLYLDAPGWPTSIGNRSKARLHLRKAVELSSDYPDNWLSLLEAYLKWGERNTVQSQLAATQEMLQHARKTLTGEKWALSWQDWDRRWDKIKAKVTEPAPHLESPRNRK
jgi:tetratricopeptide (TPR) repeat protein